MASLMHMPAFVTRADGAIARCIYEDKGVTLEFCSKARESPHASPIASSP